MKVLIIEDEKIAADSLEKQLSQVSTDIAVLGKLETVRDSVDWLKNNNTDLIFLDIHLADGLCFKIFDQIVVNTPIIFTTAYDQYAIKAFKLNSVDYILKPIDIDELKLALDKFEKIHSKKSNVDFDYKSIIKLIKNPKPEFQKRFLIHVGQKLKSIDTSNIAYFFAEEKVVYLITKDNNKYIIDQSIEKIESLLDPQYFFKISRKFIVHIDAISAMHIISKSRIKIDLNPPCTPEAIVTITNVSEFKKWLKG